MTDLWISERQAEIDALNRHLRKAEILDKHNSEINQAITIYEENRSSVQQAIDLANSKQSLANQKAQSAQWASNFAQNTRYTSAMSSQNMCPSPGPGPSYSSTNVSFSINGNTGLTINATQNLHNSNSSLTSQRSYRYNNLETQHRKIQEILSRKPIYLETQLKQQLVILQQNLEKTLTTSTYKSQLFDFNPIQFDKPIHKSLDDYYEKPLDEQNNMGDAIQYMSGRAVGLSGAILSPAVIFAEGNKIDGPYGFLQTGIMPEYKYEPKPLTGHKNTVLKSLFMTGVTSGFSQASVIIDILSIASIGSGLVRLGPSFVRSLGRFKTTCEFIFRGTSTKPEIVFNRGFKRSGNTPLIDHVKMNNKSSLISTSKSPNIARSEEFVEAGDYVYTIKKQKHGLDVNKVLDSESLYSYEVEIAVPNFIEPRDIMGARMIGQDNKFTGPFIKNPKYIP